MGRKIYENLPYLNKQVENSACLTGEAHSDYTLTCRGVAQLAAHRVWDAGVGGSSPPTPTFFDNVTQVCKLQTLLFKNH